MVDPVLFQLFISTLEPYETFGVTAVLLDIFLSLFQGQEGILSTLQLSLFMEALDRFLLEEELGEDLILVRGYPMEV